jgi:hypothetical protein
VEISAIVLICCTLQFKCYANEFYALGPLYRDHQVKVDINGAQQRLTEIAHMFF